ncbi:UNVERIFIED_CONTAM: hypothetical protein FKN15_073890, partial [Acipenser sinensis]
HSNTICSTWGNEYIKTFDGDVYQFPGTCVYNLASDCHESYLEFSVHMRRTNEGGHPTIKELEITIKEEVILLTPKLAFVNEEPISTPYYGSGILVERNEIYTKLYTKLGLTLMWNRADAVMLELETKFQNRTCGLCGDYNGQQLFNEFIFNGDQLSPIEFGNLQKVHQPNEECEDAVEEETMAACTQYVSPCPVL